MKGSLRQRAEGTWELRVFDGHDGITGKKKYRQRTFRGGKRDAQRELAKMVRECVDGKLEPTTATVGGLLEMWLAHIEREGRSPTTLRGYRSLVKQLPEGFLREELRKVNWRRLEELYQWLGQKPGRGPSTIKHMHAMLRTAFNQAIRWDMIDRNPAPLASTPRMIAKEIEPPAVKEVRAVIEAAATSHNPDNALAFRLIAATGCRRAELCGLRWSDLDLRHSKLTLRNSVVQAGHKLYEKDTKSHQQRTVSIDPSTTAALRAHHVAMKERAKKFGVALPQNAYVFSDSFDGAAPFMPDRLSKAWRRLADELKVTCRLHDLRHLQASMLLDAGESITTVASRLGHRDSATTLRVYAHLMPGADERAADIVGGALG